MLYVFLVDTGTMMSFDMNLALESVAKLKESIARLYKIPEDKQVLLISGGDNLDSNARVCSYSAGTDTNPIYLFSKGSIESSNPPSPSIDCSFDSDFKCQVEGTINMPANYMAVVARTQLAHQMFDMAKDQSRVCERLVHEQHLQHQGWAAVVANLEEIASTYREKTSNVETRFRAYLENRDQYRSMLASYGEDLRLLDRIPVLDSLIGRTGENNSEAILVKSVENEGADPPRLRMTLLEYVKSKNRRNDLIIVAEHCGYCLEQFTPELYETIMKDITSTEDIMSNKTMREIKGLEERLYGLEQLMFEAKRIVHDQGEMAQSFSCNQTRASAVADKSVFPDLCDGHRKQLKTMLKSQQQLREIHRKIVKAKVELSDNLHSRLRWVMYVERNMCDVDSKLRMYIDALKKLNGHLSLLQSIHYAPRVYLLSIAEVIRRRKYSQIFTKWAKELSTRAYKLHEREVATRKEFANVVGHHFLDSLFPGLNDLPPPFAAEMPAEFDQNLPPLEASDIEWLKQELPDLSELLVVHEVDVADVIPDITILTHDSVVPQPPTSSKHTSSMRQSVHQRLIASLPGNSERVASPPLSSSVHEGYVVAPRTHPVTEEKRVDPSADDSETEDFVSLDGGLAPAAVAEAMTTTVTVGVRDEEANQNKQRVQELKSTVALIQTQYGDALRRLRQDVDTARQFVLHYRDTIWQPGGALADQVSEIIKIVEQQVCSEKDQQMHSALTEARATHGSAVEELTDQLTLKSQKLADALSENKTCQANLQEKIVDLENLKVDMERQLAEQKVAQNELHEEDVKKMTLEHELELDGAKEEFRKKEVVNEQQLQEVHEELLKTQQELEQLRLHHTDLVSTMNERLCQNAEEVTTRLESDFLSREAVAAESARREAEREMAVQLERLQQEADQRVHGACEELKRVLNAEFDERAAQAEREREELLQREREKTALACETVIMEHKQELVSLTNRFHLALNSTQLTKDLERSPSDSSLEKIERPDNTDPAHLEQQIVTLRTEHSESKELIEEMKRQHRFECEEMRIQCDRTIRNSLTAEKQVTFNEAVNRATAEKERIIQELKAELATARKEIHVLTEGRTISHHHLPPSSPSFDDVGGSSVTSPSEGFQFISPTSPSKSATESTASPTLVGLLGASVIAEPLTQSVIEQEQGGRGKDEDHRRLEQNIMAMSVSTVGASPSIIDKVAVTTCNVDDLVLFCFNEKYDNYLAFSVTSSFYFLHNDCLEALSLTSEPGIARQNWVLAVVVEKEYCQARRVPNRFHVAMGMRFYRVRAKPWTWTGKNRMSASMKPASSSKSSRLDPSRLGSDSI